MILITLTLIAIIIISYKLLLKTQLGCMILKCGKELLACFMDKESRDGLMAMMECANPDSERIRKQIEELKHHEIPSDPNIAIARILDEYPTVQIANFSKAMVQKCSHLNQKKVTSPNSALSYIGEPLKMDISEHEGRWWRTHTDSWDNWDGSYMTFAEAKNGNWNLHINYQVDTALRGTIRRTIVEDIPFNGIKDNSFDTRLEMWDTETNEVWKLLHKTEDARLFVICAKTQVPQPRIDNIVLIVSKTPKLSKSSKEEMRREIQKRGLNWNHFFELNNDKYKKDVPVIPFQESKL